MVELINKRTIAIDDTLTKKGYAADAAAIGKAIKELALPDDFNLDDYYVKDEVDNQINVAIGEVETTLENYYTKEEIDTTIESVDVPCDWDKMENKPFGEPYTKLHGSTLVWDGDTTNKTYNAGYYQVAYIGVDWEDMLRDGFNYRFNTSQLQYFYVDSSDISFDANGNYKNNHIAFISTPANGFTKQGIYFQKDGNIYVSELNIPRAQMFEKNDITRIDNSWLNDNVARIDFEAQAKVGDVVAVAHVDSNQAPDKYTVKTIDLNSYCTKEEVNELISAVEAKIPASAEEVSY